MNEKNYNYSVDYIKTLWDTLGDYEYAICEIIVKTDSMKPLIKPGEKKKFKICKDKITLGDIILFEHNGELWCHRVVYIDNNGAITKGDNNKYHDKFSVSINQVRGKIYLENKVLARIEFCVVRIIKLIYNIAPVKLHIIRANKDYCKYAHFDNTSI